MIESNPATEISRSVRQILQNRYIIPFYQRNYNWGVTEISRLLQDIYGAFNADSARNYYIGSLVVYQREDSDFWEVIDGQQRLTTLHLLISIVSNQVSLQRLHYDSRPEVEDFFDRLLRGDILKQYGNAYQQANLTSFLSAITTINETKLDEDLSSKKTIANLNGAGKIHALTNFILDRVMVVEVKMPSHTDVVNYFEIMNNRGRQLQEHEILKAQLMSTITTAAQRTAFGYVWEACSQINRPIQKFFDAAQRKQLFGENYMSVHPKQIKYLKFDFSEKDKRYSVHDILGNPSIGMRSIEVSEHEDELDENVSYSSIIDFPNFLVHILKLSYPDSDITLSNESVLKAFKSIPRSEFEATDAMGFLERVFFYRVVFDRFVVKANAGSEIEDLPDDGTGYDLNDSGSAKWVLEKPVMYLKNSRVGKWRYATLNFKNTFDDYLVHERVRKLLSMLQVTYRQRKNKNYLQFILSLFDPGKPGSLEITGQHFLAELERFTLQQFGKLSLSKYLGFSSVSDERPLYSEGTNTPHFVFNFIDYLIWVDQKYKRTFHGIDESFEFTYRNSIEHHFPQAQRHMLKSKDVEEKEVLLHSIGNLCLISKGANSKLNDRSALDKAIDKRYSSGVLTPKRKIMYDKTSSNRNWNCDEIKEHHEVILDLLERRFTILQMN